MFIGLQEIFEVETGLIPLRKYPRTLKVPLSKLKKRKVLKVIVR